jgi:uncharacterized protein (TIGR02231 family)
MKRLLTLLAALATATLLPAAAVDSTISAVTVYTDRAVVTRTATVELPTGTTELVFANLPQALQERSLQVSGRGTAQAMILDVSARQTFVDFAANPRVQELEDQLRKLHQQVREVDDGSGVLNAQAAMLERMEAALFAAPTKDVPRAGIDEFSTALTYLTGQRTRLAQERATLDEKRTDLQTRINTVQRQLNELRGAGNRAFKTVTVRVAATTAGRLDVTLAYTVPGASWAPNYDARITSGERTVELGYFGLVRQNTGEDWKDVALTLSTARPALGGAAPKLGVWELSVFDPIALEARAREQAMVEQERRMSMRKVASAPMAMGLAADMAPPEQDALIAQATVEAGATSATFRIATAASIPSDNSPQKVPVTTAKLKAEPAYHTTPKRVTTAYLTAKVSNDSEFPLLAGPMNVFLDGTFVATSGLTTVMPGEKFDLALGADEGISVQHKRVQKFIEQTGLISKSTRITYEYLITIQNNKRSAERIIVTDQVPLSRNEKIVVRVQMPPEREVKPDDEGLLKWTLDLKPGEKRELTVKFTVEHANDVNVTGLE